MIRKVRRVGTALWKALAWPVVLVGIAWGALTLWFDGPSAAWLAGMLSAVFTLGCLGLLVLLRPFLRALLSVLGVLLLLVTWWLAIPARNDRDWSPDVARLPRATLAEAG